MTVVMCIRTSPWESEQKLLSAHAAFGMGDGDGDDS